MVEVWGGDFQTPVALHREMVMDLVEGMVIINQMVEVWDVVKMEIMGLEPVTEMVMADFEAISLC